MDDSKLIDIILNAIRDHDAKKYFKVKHASAAIETIATHIEMVKNLAFYEDGVVTIGKNSPKFHRIEMFLIEDIVQALAAASKKFGYTCDQCIDALNSVNKAIKKAGIICWCTNENDR